MNVEWKEGTRAGKAMRAVAVGQLAWQGYKLARDFVTNKTDFTVSIDEDDALYIPLHVWMFQQLDKKKARKIAAFTRKVDIYRSEEEDTGLRVRAETGHTYTFYLEGEKITARVDNESRSRGIQSSSSFNDKLILTSKSRKGQEALIGLLNTLSAVEAKTPSIYVATKWGDWRRKTSLRSRSLDTVYLPDDQKERLVSDLQDFLDSEALYETLGIPWHRGYLLYGPPGTGKTSFARALASHFNLDIYSMSLSDITSDANLGQMFSQLEERSVLLLEDIDVVHAAKERDDETDEAITASGLLNALDGLSTPHGLITFMTTNDIDVLDEALLRSGRADVQEQIGLLTQDQLEKMILGVFGRECDFKLERDVAPCDVVGIIKNNIRDLDTAWDEVREFVSER